jgi:HAD superfamily hydrolase (TIGR01509 family)
MSLSTVPETSAPPECEDARSVAEELNLFRIRAVVFDLDGVIADSHALHERAWRDLLNEMGKSPTDEFADVIRQGKPRKEILKTFFPGRSSQELTDLGARKDTLYRENSARLRPVEGVIAWIRELHDRGFLLAVATSAARQRTLDTLRQFGIETLFQVIVTASDVAAGKPDPALFLAAADALGIEAGRVLVIEDSEAGLAGAKTAGMKCALYNPRRQSLQASAVQPDLFVRTFDQKNFRALPELSGGEAV